MMKQPVQKQALELIELAYLQGPEGEGLELDDQEYEMEDLVSLRSLLSQMRSAIDVVNPALARYWVDHFQGGGFIDKHSDIIWWVGRTKTKRLAVKERTFIEWVATKDPDELEKLFSPSRLLGIVKVSGMTKAERATFVDESKEGDTLSIQNKPL